MGTRSRNHKRPSRRAERDSPRRTRTGVAGGTRTSQHAGGTTRGGSVHPAVLREKRLQTGRRHRPSWGRRASGGLRRGHCRHDSHTSLKLGQGLAPRQGPARSRPAGRDARPGVCRPASPRRLPGRERGHRRRGPDSGPALPHGGPRLTLQQGRPPASNRH